MRNFAERATRFKPLQTFIYWSAFLMVTTILDAPLGLYEGYFRERQYGLATQTLLPWLGDQLIILLGKLVFGGIVAVVLVGVVRRLSDTWWIWGAVVSMVFLIFFVMIAPVFIFPLLNKYTVLEDPRITQPILRLARAKGIPAPDCAHERERQRLWPNHAHHAQRQLTASRIARGNSVRYGP